MNRHDRKAAAAQARRRGVPTLRPLLGGPDMTPRPEIRAATYDQVTQAPTKAEGARRALHLLQEQLDGVSNDVAHHEHPLACEVGCAYCCHLRVTASAVELLALADCLRSTLGADQLATVIGNLRANAARARGLSLDAYARLRMPCGLLVNDTCIAYDERPATCRMHHSLDVEPCRRGFEAAARGGDDVTVPSEAFLRTNTALSCAGHLEGLRHAGIEPGEYELQEGLLIALELPDAAVRWAAGEDVFAPAAPRPSSRLGAGRRSR